MTSQQLWGVALAQESLLRAPRWNSVLDLQQVNVGPLEIALTRAVQARFRPDAPPAARVTPTSCSGCAQARLPFDADLNICTQVQPQRRRDSM